MISHADHRLVGLFVFMTAPAIAAMALLFGAVFSRMRGLVARRSRRGGMRIRYGFACER